MDQPPITPDASPGRHAESFTAHWVPVQSIVVGYVAAAIRRRDSVDDVVQEIAMAAAKDYDRYDPARPFLNWVLAIARHKVIDFHRREGSDRLHFSGRTLEQLSEAATQLAPRLSDRQVLLEDCLEKMPARSRRILEMRYHYDMPVKAISQKVGASSASVFTALHRLRRTLMDCIESRLQARENLS